MGIYVNNNGYITTNKTDHGHVIKVNLSDPVREDSLVKLFGSMSHGANEKCAFLILDGNVVAYNNGRGWEMKAHPHRSVEDKLMRSVAMVFGKTPKGIRNLGNRQWAIYYQENEEVGNGLMPTSAIVNIRAMLEFYN